MNSQKKIAILEKIKESTKQFFYNRKIDTVIQSFQNSNELISDIKNKTDLFLLDISFNFYYNNIVIVI